MLELISSNGRPISANEQQLRNTSDRLDQELRKLSLIATKTKSGVIITDKYGKIEWVNEAFQNISGYHLDEIKGLKPKDFLQGKNSEDESRVILKEALSKKEDVEVTIVNYTKDGKPFYNNLEIVSVFNEFGEHTHFIALQKDITNEILFKQELVKVNSRFELIANQSKIGIWEFDPVQNTIVWSDLLFDIYGIPPSTQAERLLEAWKNVILEKDREQVLISWEQLNAGEIVSAEMEYGIIRESDQSVRIVKSVIVAEKNDRNEITRMVGSSKDITELKRAHEAMTLNNIELKKINSELDNFVYSISHDLRSPLLSIKGIISLINHTEVLNRNTTQLLEMVDKSASRLDETIQDILEYSRNSRIDVTYEKFNANDLVNAIFDGYRISNKDFFEESLTFETSTEVYTDKERVRVLLKNIIGNSVKYTREGVVSTISFKMFRNNGKITFVIKDNGEGISETSKGKIYNMFFRGTVASDGAGLGLYICKEIVAKLGGAISVHSQLGVGTTMNITLPENQPSE